MYPRLKLNNIDFDFEQKIDPIHLYITSKHINKENYYLKN